MTGFTTVEVTVAATAALVAATAGTGLLANWLTANPGTARERAHLLAAAVDDPQALRGTGRHRKPTTGATP
jgi:hypothetical protein